MRKFYFEEINIEQHNIIYIKYLGNLALELREFDAKFSTP